jgi:hypothetical protein
MLRYKEHKCYVYSTTFIHIYIYIYVHVYIYIYSKSDDEVYKYSEKQKDKKEMHSFTMFSVCNINYQNLNVYFLVSVLNLCSAGRWRGASSKLSLQLLMYR